MDFTYDDDQQAIADLVDRILGEQCPPETLRTLEASDAVADRFAADAWAALAGADLLGLALPAEVGGSGLGLLEAAVVAQAVGRHVGLVPYWTSTAAAMTIARWGSPAQQERWLSGLPDGTTRLAVALWDGVETGPDAAPAVLAQPDRDAASRWLLHGEASPVPWASHADALVLPAQVGDRVEVFVVPTSAAGVELVDEQVITREPTQTVRFDAVAVTEAERIGHGHGTAADTTAAAWLAQRTRALLLATMLGVCEGALSRTARYVSEREQFGSPIGTFQAVAHRCADAYVDTEAIRLTTLQALWRLDAGLDATEALDVAGYWAAEGSHRVVHAAQHLHGGIGMDLDYPIHRYFRWAKVLDALLGGRHTAILPLGAALAAGDDLTT